jgi:hypothetical protein
VPPRYRPRLKNASLTRALPYDPLGKVPAATAIYPFSPQDAVAVITLRIKGQTNGVVWTAMGDLLDSTEDDPHFAVETESDGTCFLRFGDDRHGLRPAPIPCSGHLPHRQRHKGTSRPTPSLIATDQSSIQGAQPSGQGGVDIRKLSTCASTRRLRSFLRRAVTASDMLRG